MKANGTLRLINVMVKVFSIGQMVQSMRDGGKMEKPMEEVVLFMPTKTCM
jgi:hypothetical protein